MLATRWSSVADINTAAARQHHQVIVIGLGKLCHLGFNIPFTKLCELGSAWKGSVVICGMVCHNLWPVWREQHSSCTQFHYWVMNLLCQDRKSLSHYQPDLDQWWRVRCTYHNQFCSYCAHNFSVLNLKGKKRFVSQMRSLNMFYHQSNKVKYLLVTHMYKKWCFGGIVSQN